MSAKRGCGASGAEVSPLASTPSTSRRSSSAERAVSRIRPGGLPRGGGLGAFGDLQAAGVQRDQRDAVGQHVVHLPGDARPLGQPGGLGARLLLGLGALGPLLQGGQPVVPGAEVRPEQHQDQHPQHGDQQVAEGEIAVLVDGGLAQERRARQRGEQPHHPVSALHGQGEQHHRQRDLHLAQDRQRHGQDGDALGVRPAPPQEHGPDRGQRDLQDRHRQVVGRRVLEQVRDALQQRQRHHREVAGTREPGRGFHPFSVGRRRIGARPTFVGERGGTKALWPRDRPP